MRTEPVRKIGKPDIHKKRKPVRDPPTGFTPLTMVHSVSIFFCYRIPHRVYSIRRTTRRIWEHCDKIFFDFFQPIADLRFKPLFFKRITNTA
jgi:hypothetical protein